MSPSLSNIFLNTLGKYLKTGSVGHYNIVWGKQTFFSQISTFIAQLGYKHLQIFTKKAFRHAALMKLNGLPISTIIRTQGQHSNLLTIFLIYLFESSCVFNFSLRKPTVVPFTGIPKNRLELLMCDLCGQSLLFISSLRLEFDLVKFKYQGLNCAIIPGNG